MFKALSRLINPYVLTAAGVALAVWICAGMGRAFALAFLAIVLAAGGLVVASVCVYSWMARSFK